MGRRNLTDDQRSAIAEAILERRAKLAKIEQRRAAGKQGGRGKKKSGEVTVTPSVSYKERSRPAVAKAARVSERKLKAVRTIKRIAGRFGKGRPKPLSFIVSANLERRDLTKGQKAMALAMIYPEGQHGRGKNAEVRKLVVSTGFSAARLTQARSVLRHSRDLAESVMKGAVKRRPGGFSGRNSRPPSVVCHQMTRTSG